MCGAKDEIAYINTVHLKQTEAGLDGTSDILIDQVRAIDNRRIKRRLGEVPVPKRLQIRESLRVILDL